MADFQSTNNQTSNNQQDKAPDYFPGIRHVAIIMDGNGRWALKKGRSRIVGHRVGAEAARRIIRYAFDKGIKYISLFAFSEENWNRPEEEVNAIMNYFRRFLKNERKNFRKGKIRFTLSGRKHKLPKDLLALVKLVENETKEFDDFHLNLCVSYGGRQEILDATKKLINDIKNNNVNLDNIDLANFRNYFYAPWIPDVDLLIRTSGEIRISNFMLWQLAYAEFYFTDIYWPDFTEKEFDKALKYYFTRERRFGLTQEQIKNIRDSL